MGQINIRKNDISEKFRRFFKKFRNFMRISRKKFRTFFAIFVSRPTSGPLSRGTQISVRNSGTYSSASIGTALDGSA